MKAEDKLVIEEGFRVGQQFVKGSINRVEIDLTVLKQILDDDFKRDLFVIAFNDEIEKLRQK